MSIRTSLIGPCATILTEDGRIDLHLSGLIRRLILFDTYILDSIQPREFPLLVDAIGCEQVIELLSSKAIKVYCDALSIGQIGQNSLMETRRTRGILAAGSYSFGAVMIPDETPPVSRFDDLHLGSPGQTGARNRKEYLSRCLANISAMETLSQKQKIKLKRAIADALVTVPPGRGRESVLQLNGDLRSNSPLIGQVLRQTLKNNHGISVALTDIKYEVEEIDEGDFRVNTNLNTYIHDETEVHKTVERALLGLGGLNMRIEQMKTYDSVSGCLEEDSPLFMAKLGFLWEECRPDAMESQFHRVLELRGLPDFIPRIDKLDVSRLLAIRNQSEIFEFRHWLSTVKMATDEAIKERIESLTSKLGDLAVSKTGKVARFLTSTGIGLLGPVPGAFAGAIDTFLVEKVLPRSGVWTFVNRHYPSIFKPN